MDEVVKNIVQIIVNNGIGVACVAYMIYFQMTTMKDLVKNQNKMTEALNLISERLENLEDKITGKKTKKKEDKEDKKEE